MVNIPKATHEGELKFLVYLPSGEQTYIIAKCANLDNGLRVISQASYLALFGRHSKSTSNDKLSKVAKLPVILQANNLKPFISNETLRSSSHIEYITKTNLPAKGYVAQFLPEVCRVYRRAYRAKALRQNQIHVYERCDILSDAFMDIGITALIDEATGYQYDRPKNNLQALLELYVQPKPERWQRKFTEDFYKNISRLRGWEYSPNSRTQAFSYTTVDLVYKRIQPGLWDELKKSNPDKKRFRYHQLLTQHIGNPHLKEHIRSLNKLMKGCTNWNQFMALVNRIYPLNAIQMDIFFDLLLENPDDFDKYKDLVS